MSLKDFIKPLKFGSSVKVNGISDGIRWNLEREWACLLYSRHSLSRILYPLSRTFTMSNFLFGPFSILINFYRKSVPYLKLRSLKLFWTIFSVPSVIFGLFSIGYLEYSNKVFKWIIPFISGIRMLITALTKLCSEVCSFFFSTSFQAATRPQLTDNSV